jgi:hypothetical protein
MMMHTAIAHIGMALGMQKMKISLAFATLVLTLFTPLLFAADYSNHPEAKKFIDKMVSDHNFDRAYIQRCAQAIYPRSDCSSR